jgi:hypothetical protein
MILRSFTQNSPLLPLTYPIVIALIILSGQHELWLQSQNTSHAWMNGAYLNFTFIAILSINAFIANHIYNRSELYHSPAYLTGLVYAVFTSIACVQTGNLFQLLAQTGALISFYFAFSIFRQKKIAHQLFLSAVFMGFSSLLDEFYLLFPLVLIFLSLWNRPFSIKDLTLVIIGFFTPLLYWNSYKWLTAYSSEQSFFWTFFSGSPPPTSTPPSMPFIITLILAIVLAILSLSNKEDRQSNKTVQSKQYLVLLFVVSIGAMSMGYIFNHRIKINELVSIAPILLLSHYWTHYRTSLLAPFVFYISLAIAIIEFFHWF